MKLFLVVALFIFSYQRFIVTSFLEKNCFGKVNNGYFYYPNRCSLVDPKNNIYSTTKHNGNSYTLSFSCNENCSTCRGNQTSNYGCAETFPNAYNQYFGIPSPITATGFYFDTYPSKNMCNSNPPSFRTSFIPESLCQSTSQNIFNVKMKNVRPKSERYTFNLERDGVIIEGFSDADCKGNVIETNFLPNGKCTQIPNAPGENLIKVRRSL